ncbi:heterokaryon incompatibility protein Het-C-domain-containing protein [Elsinoe ampelina]|uniref:Heterokaryon incompatibility protein Het-C-domain-containing protein n=1 Tax=Elsinoe ampelina TaxID=302913 RepID=A0A6A6GP58_9PEZI|nr:heterokaryon incompatibility protein Het-C-domain-containing protein [Elsinoe ampelina]
MAYTKTFFLLLLVALVLLPQPTAAFGAGNIASISKVEGQNWRHGDIEDMLKTVATLKGHKWTSMMIKRVYFGNWLRDYSQAVDVGTLKGVPASTIRVLIWVLAFMTFGYATAEFEVTDERLGCYRPEEHIDNPKDYADNEDARKYDKRLRGPVLREELDVDPQTGMKNYIANERGGWATSAGYVKFSVQRSIHYGRLYTSGPNKGREEDLCEALRCLGQALHCLEDFGAHTQYVELALRELGHRNVFPHVGSGTEINVRGKRIFPLVTGTFGGVDFLHSVLGEASDHVTQSEVDDMNEVLGSAQSGKRSTGGNGSDIGDLTGILKLIPGTSDLATEAENLQRDADSQSRGFGGGDNYSSTRGGDFGGGSDRAFNPMSSMGGSGGKPITDPQEIVKKIYPILQFRDNVVRTIDGIVSKIPGLESAIEKLTETVTLFVMRLLAPYIMPLIGAASQGLKQGSSAVVDSSAKQQYIVFDQPQSSDPTHSMLSKDHFSNILNEPAGRVAAAILQYAAPRILYAWEHPEVPEQQVLDDVVRVFHHPALRDENNEAHRNMFRVVEKWVQSRPDRGRDLDQVLSKESVRAGRNHKAQSMPEGGIPNPFGGPGAVLGGNAGHAHGPIGGGQARGFDSTPANPPASHGGYGGGYNEPSAPSHGYGGNTGGYDSGSHGAGYGSSTHDSRPARHGRDDDSDSRPYGGRRDDDDDKYGSSYRQRPGSPGYGGRGHATQGSHGGSSHGGDSYGQQGSGYGQQSSGYGQETSGYGQQSSGYGQQSSGFGQQSSGYGEQTSGYGQHQSSGYGSGGHDNSSSGYGGSSYDRPSHGSSYEQPSYGGSTGGYGGGRNEDSSYGQQSGGYGQSGYGDNSGYGGQQGGYGRRDDDYGRRDDDDDDRRRRNQDSYGQGGYQQQQGGYGSGGYGGSGY